MGLFSDSSPFDADVEKATSERNTDENWGDIMTVCDHVMVEPNGPKDCLRAIYRRLSSDIPIVVMQSLALIDACVNNCGKPFHLEVASREFETNFVKLITDTRVPAVSEKARELIEKWAKEFKTDSQLALIPDLYNRLKKEGIDFNNLPSKRKSTISEAALKNPDAVASAEEEANILKAIELSMKDVKISSTRHNNNDKKSSNSGTTSMYPSMNKADLAASSSSNAGGSSSSYNNSNNKSSTSNKTKDFKARALYDFEAAEDNELTFKAGEIIVVSDSSDANWWKGSNHRGEGLFPSNFVSTDLNAQPDSPTKDKKVQFKDSVKVVGQSDDRSSSDSRTKNYPKLTEIDESRMDRLLYLLHEADPHSDKADSDELLTLEEQCLTMIPLIDRSMEIIDKENVDLSDINDKLNSAFALYHDLMKESIAIEKQVSYPGAYPGTTYSGTIIPNGQYGVGSVGQQQQQFNGSQYSQYAPVSGQNYYPSTNMPQTSQYPVQMGPSQQQPQPQQTVIPQIGGVPNQMHQQALPNYGSNSYPAGQSIPAANNVPVQQSVPESTDASGSVVNLL